jgi:transposase-like protein
MGRKRKRYGDEFKISVVKEALQENAKDAEVAAKHEISPGTLCEWKHAFLNGGFKTKEDKKLIRQMEELQDQNKTLLQALGKKDLEIELLKKKEAFITKEESGSW